MTIPSGGASGDTVADMVSNDTASSGVILHRNVADCILVRETQLGTVHM
jgi:hypothetical protein